MEEKICGIYRITNTVNGKSYVGQSGNIKTRFEQHRSELRHNKHDNDYLQNAWNKYGEENFIFEIIKLCSRDELDELEIYYIDYFKSYKDDNGYNLTLGGYGTRIVNEVLQFDAYGNFIKEFQNGIAASEELEINPSTIYACLNKKLKKADVYIFVYKSEYKDKSSLEWWLDSNRNTPVEQYDLYGNLLNTWASCAEIVRELGLNPILCLNHDLKSYHGYIWKRINDDIQITPEYCEAVRIAIEKRKKKKIYQYDLENNIVAVFNSTRELKRSGYSGWMVKECCMGVREKYKGYKWSYEELEVA